MLLDGYKFKTCYDLLKCTTHSKSTKVECISPGCPGDQLPSPGGVHSFRLAVGPVFCLLYPLLVVVDVDIVKFPGFHSGLETEGDAPHTSHRNCEHS